MEGVKLLDVDAGEATNRTVVTFVGEPEAVVEAAFRGVKRAAELIDMSKHHGAHPRMGATDVLPLIPVSGITLDECAELARNLARRISEELTIPTYCYEAAAFTRKDAIWQCAVKVSTKLCLRRWALRKAPTSATAPLTAW